MRDLDALLGSLVNIDRNSLITLLSSEAKIAGQLAKSARQRTASQRAKRREAADRSARIERIVSFLQHGEIGRDMSENDLTLCRSLEDKLRIRRQ